MDRRSDGRVVIILSRGHFRQRTRALEGPRDDVQSGGFGSHSVSGRDNGLVLGPAGSEEVIDGRGNEVDALSLERGQARDSGGVVFRAVPGFVEEEGLLAEAGIFGQPLIDVGGVEGLRPHTVGVDAFADERLDHVTGVLLLRIAVERHGHGGWRGFELGREVAVAGEGVDEVDIAIERHDRATGVVELGSPGGSAVLVGLRCLGAGVEAVHFAAQGHILCLGDVARAAKRVGRTGAVGRGEGSGAFGSELRLQENVGRRVQVAE